MTVKELAKVLHKHPNTIRNWISLGVIKAVRLGRDWNISETEVQRILQEGIILPVENKN